MRLIYADDFLDLFYVASAGQDKAFIGAVEMVLADTPTIEAEPVKHGKWLQPKPGECFCSECKTLGSPHWKRCPVCEAKMSGGDNDA